MKPLGGACLERPANAGGVRRPVRPHSRAWSGLSGEAGRAVAVDDQRPATAHAPLLPYAPEARQGAFRNAGPLLLRDGREDRKRRVLEQSA
jgi:hypothetical protein